MREHLYAYVDGFNFYHGLHETSGTQLLWLDLVALVEKLRPKSDVLKVHYFTAEVVGDAGAISRQAQYLAALQARNGERLVIHYGRFQSRKRHCKSCGNRWSDWEEKETDVNMAVTLVSNAASKEMDSALLLSADSDLVPAARVAQQLHPKLFIAAAFPPGRYSFELKAKLPASFRIDRSRIRSSLLPEEFVVSDRVFRQPRKWSN